MISLFGVVGMCCGCVISIGILLGFVFCSRISHSPLYPESITPAFSVSPIMPVLPLSLRMMPYCGGIWLVSPVLNGCISPGCRRCVSIVYMS